MRNWDILGIEPTKDKKKIKKAYRSVLAVTNPEDKPEEFMILREAYEWALEWADQPEGFEGLPGGFEGIPEGPAGAWMEKVVSLYKDFERRLKAENWDEILSDPALKSEEVKFQAEHVLFDFLAENPFIPEDVFDKINGVFAYDQKTDSENLWVDFPYDLFDIRVGADYDGFLRDFFAMFGETEAGRHEEACRVLSRLLDYKIYHPDLYLEAAKLSLQDQDVDSALQSLECIRSEHQSSHHYACVKGEILLMAEDFKGAIDSFKAALDVCPGFIWARVGIGDAYMQLGDCEEAFKWIKDVLKENRYDLRAQDIEEQLIPLRAEKLKEKAAAATISHEDVLKLAGLYIDQAMFEDAFNLLDQYSFDKPRLEGLKNIHKASASMDLENYQDVIKYAQLAIEAIAPTMAFASDEEEQEKKVAVLGNGYMLQSLAYECLEDLPSALQVLEKGLSHLPEDSLLLARKAEIHYELKEYEEAVSFATASINIDDAFHIPYRIRGNAYYELGMYSEAFGDCNHCVEIYEPELQAHYCLINILIEVGETDQAMDHIDYLTEHLSGSQLVFLRGKALEASNQKNEAVEEYRAAIILYEEAQARGDSNSHAEIKSLEGVYYRLYTALSSAKKTAEAEAALEEGLNKCPDSTDLLATMAEVYGRKADKDREYLVKACQCYEKIVENEGDNSTFLGIYAENLIGLNRFDEAFKVLETLEETGNEPLITELLRGTLKMHLGNYTEAIAHFRNGIDIQESEVVSTPYIYRDLAMIYMRLRDYDRAKQIILNCCKLFDAPRDYASYMEILRIQGDTAALYETADSLIEIYKDTSQEDLDEILEEALGCAIDEGHRDMLEKYLKYVKDGPKAAFIRARFALFNERFDKAYSFMNKVFSANPSLENEELTVKTHKLLTMSKVFYGLGNDELAKEYALKVIDLHPKNPELSGRDYLIIATQQAEALALTGDFEKAESLVLEGLKCRRCDFCRFSGCLDAWCALAFIYAVKGDRQMMDSAVSEGLKITDSDYDLENAWRFLRDDKL